jgi:hypothetical protein
MTPAETLTAAPVPSTVEHRKRVRTSALLGLFCFVVYNANFRSISAGDTYPARYLPFAIVQSHTLFLDPVVKVAQQGRGKGAFWMWLRADGHTVSIYPVAVPVLVAPLYVPPVAYLHWRGATNARFDSVARLMEKLSASLIAALSVSLLYLLLRRRANASVALLLVAAYAFGTTTWVISSQALWQHGIAALLVIAALLLLTGQYTVWRAIATGIFLGLLAANRPPDVILAGALGMYGLLFWGRRRWLWLMTGAALPAAALIGYNFAAAGNLLGGYGLIGKARFFSHNLPEGIAGILVSPTRGLFTYSPFLLFVLLAWRYRPATREDRALTLAMTMAVTLQIVLYAKADWRGGLSWGPRYMTDLLPFLLWMLVPVVTALRGFGRIAFHGTVAVSIVIEVIGAFYYQPHYDSPIFAADDGWKRHDMRAVWHWRNAAFLTSPREGLAPAELLSEARGTIDAVEAGGRFTSVVTAGQQIVVHGWALTGDRTPFQIALSIDGGPSASSTTFFDRTDVRETLGAPNPSGWRIPIDTTGMKPGEHLVTAFVWFSGKGEGHYLDDYMLIVSK